MVTVGHFSTSTLFQGWITSRLALPGCSGKTTRYGVQARFFIWFAGLGCLSMAPGCFPSGDVFVRDIFNGYDKVAIWPGFGAGHEGGLQRVHEELFLPLYGKAFPSQRLIERRDLTAILGEQDILPDRLDDRTRAEIRRIYGVKGIVFPNYTTGSTSQLAVKVIDTETGEIVAALVTTGEADKSGQPPTSRLIRDAIASLKAAASRNTSENRPAQQGHAQ